MFRRRRYATAAVILAVALNASSVSAADPVGDFFKRVGRTLSKPIPPAKGKTRKSSTTGANTKPTASPAPAGPQSAPQPSNVSAPAAQPTPAVATSAPQSDGNRDLPYAVPAPNRPGFVTSPYAPTRGFVDVRGFPSGTEVKDPYTGKVFRTP